MSVRDGAQGFTIWDVFLGSTPLRIRHFNGGLQQDRIIIYLIGPIFRLIPCNFFFKLDFFWNIETSSI